MSKNEYVEELARDIVKREGGYVNNPNDRGGATNWGVTIGTMRALGIDLDGDGQTTVSDVKLLTLEQAVDIYIKHYFNKPRIAELPYAIQASVFDMYVNAGSNAAKILQRLLREFGEQVGIDGAIGPQTIAAAASVQAKAPNHFFDAYGIARRNYYFSIADSRRKNRVFARSRNGGKGGWITRAEEFMDPRYHMTSTQFETRTAKW
jgi:lysozyme family protein